MTSPQDKVEYSEPSEAAFSKLPFLITLFTHKTVFPTLFIIDLVTIYQVLSNLPESAHSVAATRKFFSLSKHYSP